MADKPILFSAPMVCAQIDDLKTQTRRGLVLRRYRGFTEFGPSDTKGYDWHLRDSGMRWHDLRHAELLKLLPYQVGDRLYVREHWRTFVSLDAVAPRDLWAPGTGRGAGVLYIADNQGMSIERQGNARFYGPREDAAAFGKHRQAMHMPRWASRLTLTVTDVRVERLQDISEADALAEGVKPWPLGDNLDMPGFGSVPAANVPAKTLYCYLWEHINGAGSWTANPWIAAYTFTVQLGNIDQLEAA